MTRSAVPRLRLRFRTAAAAAAAVLSACATESAVWLAPDTTAGSLTFVLGRERGHERPLSALLRVERCDVRISRWQTGDAMWIADVQGTSRVRYGESRDGVVGQIPARTLEPGCYYAAVSGPGSVVFRIHADGTVEELPELPD